MSKKMIPRNLTAMLQYQARGNPPGAHPASAVGNFFPGLEFNFLNVWKRILVGIELLESSGEVIGVDPDAPPEHVALVGGFLVAVEVATDGGQIIDATLTTTAVTGPAEVGGGTTELTRSFLEWNNLLADLHHRCGGSPEPVMCAFQKPDNELVLVPFLVRRLVDPVTGMISAEANLPGELTESLCSPWQTDFIGCACYYWSANRPDYVNVWSDASGNSGGHNWLDPGRETRVPAGEAHERPFYTLEEGKTLEHEDIMQGWEHKLRFVIQGRDES